MKVLLRNLHIISPEDSIDEVADIYISDGVIKKIGRVKSGIKFDKVCDLKNKTCVPGLFDMHVHFRDPGQTHKENFKTGTEAAANGGFTGVLCMPNTNPVIDSPVLVRDLINKTSGNIVDVKIAASATLKSQGETLSPILSLHEAGASAFTDDGLPIYNPEIFRRALEYTSQLGSIVIQHCEDKSLSNKGVINEGFISTLTGLKGIPAISETSVIARDLLITEFVRNSKYHIQHISCGQSVSLLRDAKIKGINVTGEVCPHHFILTDKFCTAYDANYKMNPPLRTNDDVEEIKAGLKDDTIEVICTDHAPHTEYEKNQNFYDSPFGIIGLETSVGLTFTHLVKSGVISFEQMIYKMSINPRRIIGLNSIRIKEGENANLTILDTKAKWIVDKNKFKSKCRNTPFNGYQLDCKPYCVLNNNQIVFSKL